MGESQVTIRGATARSLAGMVIVSALAGCLGGGGGTEEAPGTSPSTPGESTPPTGGNPGSRPPDEGPTRHPHHSWGDPPLAEVAIFWYQSLELRQDLFKGSEESCRTMGHVEFDLETDGNHAGLGPDDPAINGAPADGGPIRADVVFGGTSHLRVELTAKDPNLVGELYFKYKPANFNFMLPDSSGAAASSCGHKLTVGEPLIIPVSKDAVDPPHQHFVSMWKFMILAANELGMEQLPTFGKGVFALEIWAVNGGETSLDPAHPNLWGDGLTYDLQCVTGEVADRQYIVWAQGLGPPVHKPPEGDLAGFTFAYSRIVPLLTERVEIRIAYENRAPGNAPLDLWYFAADDNEYMRAPLKEGETNVYEVWDPDRVKADPPYEAESLWRFMLLPRPIGSNVTVPPTPVTGGGSWWVTAFEGSYEMCGTAYRDPQAAFE